MQLLFSKEELSKLWHKSKSFRRYVIVGLITNGLNIGAFILLNRLGLFSDLTIGDIRITGYQILETILYFLTVILNFSMHKKWTFDSKGLDVHEIKRYIIMLIVNFIASIVLITSMVEVLNINVEWAKVLTVGVIISWNFFALKFFVYKK